MGLRRAVLVAAAALIPVAAVVTAQPAAADYVFTDRRDLTFTFRGHPLTCSVEGTSTVDYDDVYGQVLFVLRTTLVDDEHRCQQALEAVTVGLLWWRTGAAPGSIPETTYTDTVGPEAREQIWLQDVERAQAYHGAFFTCDEHPYPCALEFWSPVPPFPK